MKDETNETKSDEYRAITYFRQLKKMQKLLKLQKLKVFAKSTKNFKFPNLLSIKTKFKIFKRSKKVIASSKDTSPAVVSSASKYFNSFLNFVTISFIAYDTYEKVDSVKHKGKKYMTLVAIDNLIFHYLASYIIPGFLINFILKSSKSLVNRLLPARYTNYSIYLGIGITLVSIPLMIKPIDQITGLILDNTYREYLNIRINKH